MKDRNDMGGELSAFEAHLSRLAPTGVIERNALIFRAGLAAGMRTRRRWQMLAAAAVCLAACAAMLSSLRPAAPVVERVVYVPRHQAAPASRYPLPMAATAPVPADLPWAGGAPSEFSYFRLRLKVMEHGVAALPTWGGASRRPRDARRLVDELLRKTGTNG